MLKWCSARGHIKRATKVSNKPCCNTVNGAVERLQLGALPEITFIKSCVSTIVDQSDLGYCSKCCHWSQGEGSNLS